MHTLHIHNLSYQHPDGQTQFKQLSFSINEKLTAIIGANGSGKSILLSILANQQQPSTGHVEFSGTRVLISQQQLSEQHLQTSSSTIAQLLGVDKKLAALNRIEQGSCHEADFNLINDDWLCEQYYKQQLLALAIDTSLNQPIKHLSGGQQRRLMLFCALQTKPDLLILDEPSNHLDQSAKQWLIDQLHAFKGQVIVVSHDRQLLNQCDAIIELSSQGVHYETGNYEHFNEQKTRQQTALTKQINNLDKERQKHLQQTQLNREKAQQRAAQGNKKRNTTSQPKVMLDFKKNSAQASKGASERLASAKHEALTEKRQALQQQLPNSKAKTVKFTQPTSNKRLLFIEKLTLPFSSANKAITLQIFSGDKLHLKGANGSGKSTLLRMINDSANSPVSTALQLNSKVLYIDQHSSFLGATDTLCNALEKHCQLKQQTVRHLLANIGFKGENIYRPISQLSGGEKMQLAMLIAAQNAADYLLLLDEPDNHLDLANKQHLAQNLADFTGSFILVSHDEEFIKQSNVLTNIILK
ncbi:ABC-F family ATP-binding cassette domain-containing protein [Pseudoalteromonas sp. SR41-8]|uniref:ATP-binding cassette domain-containing protein n=1 Tax=Pseudoalteromonas sp. SR41-8 TaxID=2760946 RepID=UPI0015FEE136|nr:ATP-binding cassette domain-containing protein [Pseudoalteromonas sp. SR41-8]MBB1310619.1 ABC-F family ATP-binding cassette domain-containing protein [Pseudoalteromonas sp. SR41-8]